MDKVAPDQVIIDRIGNILRVTRKHLGVNQTAVAPRLGLDQSALSRVESGKQMLTATQWMIFCELTHISPDAALSGFIELDQPESAMRLPQRYAFEKHSKVRSLLPLLAYARQTLGERIFRSFLESSKLDEDFFLNLNAEINFNFTIDLAEVLLERTGLSSRDAENVTRTAREGKSHGSLRHYYDYVCQDPIQLLSAYLQNAPKYGRYFRYEVLEQTSKKMELAIEPTPQLSEFSYREHPVLQDFLAHYDKGYLRNFSAYGGQSPLNITLLENHNKGASRCVYRLSAGGSASRDRKLEAA